MYKYLETMEDLEEAFSQIPDSCLDKWADSFWSLYSQGINIRYRSK